MPASIVGICNSALGKIGAERIVQMTDTNKRAIACNEAYEKCRDEVLRAHPWNFAIMRTTLAALADAPAFEWDYQYQLPEDCVRVLSMYEDEEFKIEGRVLLTNSDEVSIRYISNAITVNYFDPCFAEALSARIAADISYLVAQSVTLTETNMKVYERQLKQARTMDAQEGSADVVESDDLLNSRY